MEENEKERPTEEQMKDLEGTYSEAGLWDKLKPFAKKIGIKAVFQILVLFYSLKSDEVSNTEKALIAGALAYFILPVDLIPDAIPFVGFTDDISAIVYVLKKINDKFDTGGNNTKENEAIIAEAAHKIKDYFSDLTEDELLDLKKGLF